MLAIVGSTVGAAEVCPYLSDPILMHLNAPVQTRSSFIFGINLLENTRILRHIHWRSASWMLVLTFAGFSMTYTLS